MAPNKIILRVKTKVKSQKHSALLALKIEIEEKRVADMAFRHGDYEALFPIEAPIRLMPVSRIYIVNLH